MGGRAKPQMILGGKRNLGRKSRKYDKQADVCKAIWETPNFYQEPEPAHPQEAEINKLLSEGDSVREIAEKLGIDHNIVKRVRAKGIRLHPEWQEASRKRSRERSLQRLATDDFRALLRRKQKERWQQRREADATLVLPEAERTAEGILANHPQTDWQLDKYMRWSKVDAMRLEILASAGIDPTLAASVFKRSEKTIAYKARDLGIYIPPEWSAFLPKPKYIAHPRERRVLLNYPFMIQVDREKDADLLAVNALVPKGIPDHMRGDICQDILLAVYERKANLATLQKRPDLVKQLMAAWKKRNLENGGYGIMQFDPYGDDERSMEEQIAARTDWDRSQRSEALSRWEAMAVGFSPATQYDEVYAKEVDRERMAYAKEGIMLSHTETESRLAKGDKISSIKSMIPERIRLARFVEECGFELCDPRVLNAAYAGESYESAFFKVNPSSNHNGKYLPRNHVTSLQTQYVEFTIPNSRIRKLVIRISDHASNSTSLSDLDTYKLGVDGVMKILAELSGNVGKYEKVYRKWGDAKDLLNNGLEGFSDVA